MRHKEGTICGELSSVDEDVSKPEVVVISCSDESEAVVVSSSDSDSDADVTVITSTKSWKRKIRRILDDTELGEETKKKIAIEKERQKRLKSLCGKILFNLEKRVELLTKWKDNGGVLLIGYAAFRNLFLGKYVKDRDVDNEISCLLQNKERTGTNWKDISVLLAGFFGLYDSCRVRKQ
ncbi:peroxisomal membrane protein 11d [Phtheirospermum japonicum]|uniref:Peroxisomal membrane protein 11d n=1 Tax=Phtheirospermum japonicum TaxID=374723 RepID=A0A830CPN0_9LAMI|nr:peroxisomal membrane protein 11d [Phtheirospermum japonicum]